MEFQEYISLLNIIIVFVIGLLAFWIGFVQNDINKRSLKLNDYADVFLMPQNFFDRDNNITVYNILIKNASAYPIYLNKYILNGTVYDVGSSIIPSNSENWYQFPITKDIQDKKYFSVSIFFEDYTERKYQTNGSGEFGGSGWGVKTQKRKEIK